MELFLVGLVILLVAGYAISYPKLPKPGVYHWPVFGATVQFIAHFDTIPDWILEINADLGFTRETWSFAVIAVGPFAKGAFCINDPEIVKHVTKTNFSKYELREVREPLAAFLGGGIFRVDGPSWAFHRKVAVQMFSKSLMREGTLIAVNKTRQLVDILDDKLAKGGPFDVQKLMFGLTMDVFALLAFGIDIDSIAVDHPFAKAFDRVQELSNNRYRNPFWKAARFAQTPGEGEITKGVQVMKDFAMGVIKSRRDSVERGENLGPDLITRFVQRATGSAKVDLSDQDMVDIVLNFVIAGRDTTASGLSWALFELTQNPEHVDTMLKELEDCMDRKFNGEKFEDLEYDQAFDVVESELPFCKAVVLETLRMHPSVMKQMKSAVEDDVLPDGTRVSAGQCIFWSPYSMGRDPSLWDEPNTFMPSRWLANAATEDDGLETPRKTSSLYGPVGVSDYKYTVFNSGNRVCIGRPLAFLEMKLVLTSILPKFKFTLTGPPDAAYKNSLVSPLSAGLKVNVERR